MKTVRLALWPVIAALLFLNGSAFAAAKNKEKPVKITLEDIIFDVQYLKQALGPKTLLTLEKPAPELPPELTKAITDHGLNATTKFVLLPADFGPLKLKDSIPYSYPQSMRRGRTTGRADFLAYVGADGAVKTLFCHHQDDRMFALAVAAAVVRWKYEPMMIQGTAVPVLYAFGMEFRGDNTDTIDMRRELRIITPTPTTPPPPPGGGG